MPGKRISRNDPCPCGSGKKFKNCCIHKGIDWQARQAAAKPPLPRPRAAPPPGVAALTPFGKVDARLKEAARQSPAAAAWKELVGRLSETTPVAERMRAYRAVREAGVLPDAAACFLIDHAVQWTPPEGIAEAEDGEDDEAADEGALDRHTLAMLRRFGADDLADLYAADRLEYDRRHERGRQFFFGPPDEDLAKRLREKGIID